MLQHLYNLVKNFTQPREIIWPPAFNNFTEIGTIHSQSLLYRQNKYINIFREIYFTPSLTAFQVQCSRYSWCPAQSRPMHGAGTSASKRSIRRFVITEKAPTRAFSWLKAATTAFTFKTLLRHYAKRALTPRSLNVKLGPQHKSQKGRAGWLA